MGEGIEGYPRWDGVLSDVPRIFVIAKQEIRRTWYDVWGMIAIVVVAAYTLVYVGSLQSAGSAAHTIDTAVTFLDNLRWGALGIAAIMAGPALLGDKAHGALELYLSRAVTRFDYLMGKIGATFDMAALAVIGPGLVYWVVTLFLFQEHPDAWMWFPLGVIAYGLLWAVLVAGLGLGLSCVSSSGRAATLVLFGSFALVEIFVGSVLQPITQQGALNVVSPFSSHAQQVAWAFPAASAPFDFPGAWGLLVVAALSLIGWIAVVWKHPRLAGAEDVGLLAGSGVESPATVWSAVTLAVLGIVVVGLGLPAVSGGVTGTVSVPGIWLAGAWIVLLAHALGIGASAWVGLDVADGTRAGLGIVAGVSLLGGLAALGSWSMARGTGSVDVAGPLVAGLLVLVVVDVVVDGYLTVRGAGVGR